MPERAKGLENQLHLVREPATAADLPRREALRLAATAPGFRQTQRDRRATPAQLNPTERMLPSPRTPTATGMCAMAMDRAMVRVMVRVMLRVMVPAMGLVMATEITVRMEQAELNRHIRHPFAPAGQLALPAAMGTARRARTEHGLLRGRLRVQLAGQRIVLQIVLR